MEIVTELPAFTRALISPEPNEANRSAARRRGNAPSHLQKKVWAFAPIECAARPHQYFVVAQSESRPDDTPSSSAIAVAERCEFVNESDLLIGDRASVDQELLDARRRRDEALYERDQRSDPLVA